MNVEVCLFGAFRDYAVDPQVFLEVADDATVAQLREALAQHCLQHWPNFNPALLARSAFASETTVLRDADPLPADGRMAILPPVSGG